MNASNDSTTRRRVALAALAGFLVFLGYTSWGTRVAALVCLVPLFGALEGASRRAAIIVGLVFGATMNLVGYYWLIGTMQLFGGFSWPLAAVFFVILAVYQGGLLGSFAILFHHLRDRGLPAIVAAPIAIAAAERLYPLLFPSYLGAALHEVPVMLQTVDLGGPILLSMVVAVVNVGLYEALRALRTRTPVDRRTVATALVVLIATVVYGAARMRQIDALVATAPSLRVGMVQASVGIIERERDPREAHLRHVALTLELQRDHAPDLIVWPESGFGYALPDGIPTLRGVVAGPELATPLLFGAGRRDADGQHYNTAYFIDRDGRVLGTYDKTYLLAFGEYMPLGEWFPKLYELSPGTSRMLAGTHVRPMAIGPYRMSVLICYEDLLPGFTRRVVREASPHVLVNLTNDAWFGDTLEPWLHLALAKLRAVEHHRYLVRSTNTGVSAIIDPSGRMTSQGGVFTRENIVGEARMLELRTLYERLGDVPGWAGVLLVIASAVRRRP